MQAGMVITAYIIAAVLFIMSLGGLSQQESAKRGIWLGIVGMGIALFATLLSPKVMGLTTGLSYIIIAMLIGAAIGIYMAKRVAMTEMPELVAILHSFVGLAAVFVAQRRVAAFNLNLLDDQLLKALFFIRIIPITPPRTNDEALL